METISEKDQIMGLLDKDFKPLGLNMTKELKEDVDKVKKTTNEQKGKIKKDIKNIRRNQK